MSPGKYDNHQGNESSELSQEDVENALEEALELDTQSQIFLEMRKQNLELLKIAAKVAGYSGDHPPLKPGDVKNALRNIWDIYSEVYTWVDPEESQEDEEMEEEED
ncbi:MAG: hypothetical protein ABS79_06095 [Planctomycetes bacterium SCN 63-9]|nr:MAG: hypothetical protein ABS79_06095 [Planctomycetes bacterium SCN 63-9]